MSATRVSIEVRLQGTEQFYVTRGDTRYRVDSLHVSFDSRFETPQDPALGPIRSRNLAQGPYDISALGYKQYKKGGEKTGGDWLHNLPWPDSAYAAVDAALAYAHAMTEPALVAVTRSAS